MTNIPTWYRDDLIQIFNQYERDRLPHGLLLIGHPGDGSTHFQQLLAELLLCSEPSSNGPCGQCKSCRLLSTGHHPDFLKVEPEGKSMTIKVDAIRHITERVSETAQQGGNKVVSIESAHKMNVNAANALLKVLEEPTDKTFILLEAEQLGKLLPTIRSRCRIVHLSKPSSDESLAVVSERRSGDNPDVLLSIAGGHPLAALALSDDQVIEWQEIEQQFTQNSSFIGLSQFLAKKDTESALQQILLWVDSGIRMKSAPQITVASVSTGLLKSLAGLNSVSLFQFRDYIIELIASIQRNSNLNGQLMSEELVSRWFALRGNK
jgi:DNA polymerase-3 subunit delta'